MGRAKKSTAQGGPEAAAITGRVIASASAVPKERAHFRALLLSNPNYFGNLRASALAPVHPLCGDTSFESLTGLGFHPQSRRLDAIVSLGQAWGYGGPLCGPGSQEIVRFYVSHDDGRTWVDQGHASVTVWDVPECGDGGPRPSLALGVPCRALPGCGAPGARNASGAEAGRLKLRAILAWNEVPPPDEPDWLPVWGTVREALAQADAAPFFAWQDLMDAGTLQLAADVAARVDLAQPVAPRSRTPASLATLHALYRNHDVETHRYALPDVQKLIAQPDRFAREARSPDAGPFGDLDLDWPEVLAAILDPEAGNTRYESLEGVGYNPASGELVATVCVKRPVGYGGPPDRYEGSLETVSFWADFALNGCFETWLGVGSVRVHDVEDCPPEGLRQAVFLPVSFHRHRRPCDEGTRLVPVRAVLSWGTVSDPAFPSRLPPWGERRDALVALAPGGPVADGDFRPRLTDVSGQRAVEIDQATGLAAGDRPFGGALFIAGEIPGALTLEAPDRIKYRVQVRPLPDGHWQTLANDFAVHLEQQLAPGKVMLLPFTQSVDASGYYTYRDHGIGRGSWRRLAAPVPGLLAVWYTQAPMSGRWDIRIEALDTLTGQACAALVRQGLDGSARQDLTVTLDQAPPVPALALAEVSHDHGATWQPVGPRAEFTPGVRLRGRYGVADAHFGALSLRVEPAGPARGAQPQPAARHYPLVPGAGESAAWLLDTAGMEPGAYTLRLDARDRCIASGRDGWRACASVAFCLRPSRPAERAPARPQETTILKKSSFGGG